jgi:hypothetical protein
MRWVGDRLQPPEDKPFRLFVAFIYAAGYVTWKVADVRREPA